MGAPRSANVFCLKIIVNHGALIECSSFKTSLFTGRVFWTMCRLTRTNPGKTKSKLKSKFKHHYTVSLKYESEHHKTPHRSSVFFGDSLCSPWSKILEKHLIQEVLSTEIPQFCHILGTWTGRHWELSVICPSHSLWTGKVLTDG